MNQTTTSNPLTGPWRFTELEPRGKSVASNLPWMPAEVPGHVHLDLVRNGVIEHPFRRMAERACAWVDETDWVYETTFTVEEPPAHAFLRFNGLDTVAEIYLNGEELGRTDNMFVEHEFWVGSADSPRRHEDAIISQTRRGEEEEGEARGRSAEGPEPGRLRPGLRAGENTLRVIFRSALRVGRERQAAYMNKAGAEDTLEAVHWNNWGPRSFVRKAQYMYGWDWGPELVSCGIWRMVELVVVPVARIVDWRHEVKFQEDGSAVVDFEVDVEQTAHGSDSPLNLECFIYDQNRIDRLVTVTMAVPFGAGRQKVPARLTISEPRLWWPNGTPENPQAEPFSYEGRLSIAHGGTAVHDESVLLGLRTIELRHVADPEGGGEGFQFVVNGEPLFAKGANWIPNSSFPAVTMQSVLELTAYTTRYGGEPERVYRMVQAAADAGFNMLRVWGGGLYESDEFYNLCDRLGILVWQDFTYACAYYPDDEPAREAARQEAVKAVRRLRNRACLALWCGNNENAEMFHDQWTMKVGLRAPRYIGERIYHEVLPAVLAEEDPRTPYWPSSPWGGDDPQSETHGDRHNWNVWHTKGVNLPGVPPGDWPNYRMDDSRFCSEFGFSASCGMTAWERWTEPQDRWPRSPVVRWHDKTRKDYEVYLNYITLHFPELQSLEDLVYYSQINQAEALKCGIEHWRRRKGRCWGTLFWQLNDCWPVQSWSVIDSEGEPKAAWWAAKRFYAPVLLSLVREGTEVRAHLTNDLLEHIQGDVTIRVESMDGDVLLSETLDAYVDANGAAEIGALDVTAVLPHARDVYVYAWFEPAWEIGQERIENFLFLAEPKDLRLADPGLSVNVEADGTLVVSAKRFAPYLWWRLEGAGVSPTRDGDNFFHLRPGEARRIPTGDLTARDYLRVRTL